MTSRDVTSINLMPPAHRPEFGTRTINLLVGEIRNTDSANVEATIKV
jgi:hypothetical protein